MESNNIPKCRVAIKPAPLTAQTAGMPGKPPKLNMRLRMAAPTVPQVIEEPCKRDYAHRFSGKQRIMGWVIGFLIIVVVVLSVVIKLVQTDVKNEKQTNVTAMAQLEKEKAVVDAAEKEKAVLKTSIAELEKQVAEEAVQQKVQNQALEQLKENLAKEKQARTEVEAKLIESIELQKAAQNEIADLHREINDMEEQITGQENLASALQDELGKAQKARQEAEAKAGNQAQTDAQAQHVAGGLNQQKAAEIEAKIAEANQACAALAKEKQARTEVEAKLTSTTEAKEAAQKETEEIKRKIKDMEDQLDKQEKQTRALKDIQDELSKERKVRQELEAKAEEKTLALAATEKESNALKTQLADMDKEYAAKLEQVKAMEQLRERQSQVADTPAFEGKPKRGEPESVAATERKIMVQANDAPGTNANDSVQDTNKAKAVSVIPTAVSAADRHYMIGIQKWDAGDVDGAIAEFKKTVSLDSSLAGAYYNIALGYVKKGDRDEACDYAYKAGEIYLQNKNNKQATRMVVLIKNIDPSSSLIEKLRKKIAKK